MGSRPAKALSVPKGLKVEKTSREMPKSLLDIFPNNPSFSQRWAAFNAEGKIRPR